VSILVDSRKFDAASKDYTSFRETLFLVKQTGHDPLLLLHYTNNTKNELLERINMLEDTMKRSNLMFGTPTATPSPSLTTINGELHLNSLSHDNNAVVVSPSSAVTNQNPNTMATTVTATYTTTTAKNNIHNEDNDNENENDDSSM
jgi:hypothetical protein